jgi:hypothetical protein
MSQDTLRIGEYYHAQKSGFVRVLALSVRHTMTPERPEQSLTLELSREDGKDSIVLSFFNVRQLQLEQLHPGCTCYLNIDSLASSQWEGVKYRVSNIEQDLTFNFYCAEFTIHGKPMTSAGAI